MNSSTSHRTWIGSNNNSDGGITVYTVACYLSEGGLQADVFAFEHDAYLYLVDHAGDLVDNNEQIPQQIVRTTNHRNLRE